MSDTEIPDGVREWLEFGMDPNIASIESKSLSDLEGASIITGIVGNELGPKVREFAEEHCGQDHLAVVDFNDREEWGSLAIPFHTRSEAEEFRKLIEECGGHLRLSSGRESGWFLYEAE